jgi:hypothetical protein
MSETDTSTHSPPPADPRAQHHPDVRSEVDVLPRGLIARVMFVALMVAIALGFATYLIMHVRLRALRPSMKFPEQSLPAPREVANVRAEVFRMPHPIPTVRAQQAAALETFGWIDRDRRLARIPIEAAMDIVAGAASGAGGAP